MINFSLASHTSSWPTRGRSRLKLKRKAAVFYVNKHSGYKVGSSHTRRVCVCVCEETQERSCHPPKKSLSSCSVTDFITTNTQLMDLEVFCLIWIFEVVLQISNSSLTVRLDAPMTQYTTLW